MLSIVVAFFNNRREAPRTLHSLTRGYQRGAADLEYEVIAVDNGSVDALDAEEVRAFGPEFSHRYVPTRSISPAAAINTACRECRGDELLIVIDGAHILSPGILAGANQAFRMHPSPFVATVPFHLGPKVQNESILEGYCREVEDLLLQRSGWTEDGYRLYSITGAFSDGGNGWFGAQFESGCFGLRKDAYLSLGGLDEQFVSRGGGLVNLDIFQRALAREDLQYVMLLGEGTFHQFHGGVASNAPRSEHPWAEFNREFERIRGRPFARVPRRPLYLGSIPPPAWPAAAVSMQLGASIWQETQAT